MAGKHLSEDEIKYVISADSSKAQQELHQLGKSTAALRREEKARRSAMIELEATGKKNSAQYQRLREECREYTRQIKDNEEKMKKLRSTLDVSAMTMVQLRKYAKELSSELNNTSKAASPQKYAELEARLQGVNMRIEDLRNGAVKLRQHFSSMEALNVMAGNVMTKLAELAGNTLKKFAGFISESISKSVELAESADGITHAFGKIGNEEYLQELREATKGTVNDVELMKAAVKAKDFRIPLEDLGKYLSFAQLKAQQTGQSLDYMVDSIVTGLGRQSPQILDNLGISAAEIKEQTKQTGDFMKAVAGIVENNLAKAGETYISAADRAERRTVELENAQRKLGEALLPLKEQFADVFGQFQLTTIKTIKYLVQHRDTLLLLGKAIVLLIATYGAYVAGQKLAHLWSLRLLAVSKLKAAATAVENTMLELSVLRHAVLNKTMKTSIALQKAFNVVLKLSPWGLVLGAITLVVGALLLFRKRTDAATAAQKTLNSIHEEAIRKVEVERVKIEMLTRRIHDNSLSLGERHDAISALQKIVPDYTAKLSREGKVYEENTGALKKYLNALKEKALLEGAKGTIAKLSGQKAELMAEQTVRQQELDKLKEEQKQFVRQNAGRPQTSGGSAAPGAVNAAMSYSANVSALSKKIKNIDDKIKTVDVSLEAIDKAFGKQLAEDELSTGKGNSTPPRASTGGGGTKSKSTSTGSTPDPDDTFTKNFAAARQKEIDNADAAYQQDTNNLNTSLARKKISQEQYDIYTSALATRHTTNLLAIEQKYQEQSRQAAIKDAEKKQQLQDTQDRNVEQAEQRLTETQIAAQQKYQDSIQQVAEQGKVARTLTLEEERDAKLAVLEGYYLTALEWARQNGEDTTAVERAYQEARLNIADEYAGKQLEQIRELERQKAQARQSFGLDTFDEQVKQQMQQRREAYDRGLLTEQEYLQSIEILNQQAEEHLLQLRQQYGLVSQQELYNAELDQLKLHLQNKELSEEEYEEAVKNLKISKMKESFDYFSNLSGNAAQALQDAETANVEAKYDAEIEAARNAGKDTTELEKKKADDKLKIQKKYADVNFAIKASQIIADTATSIMRAYSDLGPIAGSAAAALMGVTGVAQLAAANAERQKVKKMTLNGTGGSPSASGTRVATGLESGGYIDVEREQDGRRFNATYDPMKRGFVDKPTVIVGEGGFGRSREWVASNAAVENPTVAPIIDIIDRAQRTGSIRTLDMNKIMLRYQGRAAGGFIGRQPSSADAVNSGRSVPSAHPAPDNHLIDKLYNLLDRIASEGIPASVALTELEQKQQLRDQARRFGSKG
ncbi:2-oxoacid:ferredoxin oxidoreductase subunit delta [Prevotella sp. HUN102]|uniref:2-oxoacid:ferredoxin oxidoreductase subunit delta n=1 Tax=Prevotella sp. HUN102 TaxID=1392486 RepID=UPI00048BC588|nr:2-oxoacid:ferredoxin oxidoreductase subunit delta [Prevotella sp. HUN102]